MNQRILLNVFVFLLLIHFRVQAQDDFQDPSKGELVIPGANKLIFCGNAEKFFSVFYNHLDTLAVKGKGRINIVHIGDSHIQAGFIPQVMRERLRQVFSNGTGGRGLVFPYKIAHSNGPPDYAITFSGKWEYCRNAEQKKQCELGLTGFYVRTRDSITGLSLRFRENYKYSDFNFLRILTEGPNSSFRVELMNHPDNMSGYFNKASGTLDFRTGIYMDSLSLRITRVDTMNHFFTLYGLDLENNDDGIAYHSFGVNGASVESFLGGPMLEHDLGMVDPDWIIISLGTNDASMSRFDGQKFEADYLQLIQRIRKVNPGVPVLLTIPGDYFRKRKYDNKNIPELRDRILSVAEKSGCAVWDLYGIMGGAKSILVWYKAGMVARDKLHFSRNGYEFQGNLLFNAFMRSYLVHLDNRGGQKK